MINSDVFIAHMRRIVESCDTTQGYNEGFADGIEFAISFAAFLAGDEEPIGEGVYRNEGFN